MKRKIDNTCNRNNGFYDYKRQNLQIMNRGIFKANCDLSAQTRQNKH